MLAQLGVSAIAVAITLYFYREMRTLHKETLEMLKALNERSVEAVTENTIVLTELRDAVRSLSERRAEAGR